MNEQQILDVLQPIFETAPKTKTKTGILDLPGIANHLVVENKSVKLN